jgi:integrase/recombinase XerD
MQNTVVPARTGFLKTVNNKVPEQNRTDVYPLIAEYLIYIDRIDGAAPKTVDNRRYVLNPFFKRMPTSDITRLTIYNVNEYFLDNDYKPSTVSTIKQTIRLFFQWCQEYKEIDLSFNYAAIKRKKYRPARVRSFTREEVADVIAHATEPQDKIMIALMFETGMRIGEILAFKVEDIQGFQIQVNGKGDDNRIVCASASLMKGVRTYLAERQITSGCVFRPLQEHYNHSSDAYTSAYGVRDRLKRAFKNRGHTMYPHQLRHSFAMEWLRNNGDIRSLQMLMGHKSIETTQWYLHFTDNHLAALHTQVFQESLLT